LEYAQFEGFIRRGISLQDTLMWAKKPDKDLQELQALCDIFDQNGPHPVHRDPGKSASYSTQSRKNAILLLRILLAHDQRRQWIQLPTTERQIEQQFDDLSHSAASFCTELWSAIQSLNPANLSSVRGATIFFYLYVLKEVGMLPPVTLELVKDYMHSLQQLKLSVSQILAVERLGNSSPLSSRIWKVWLRVSREELFY
jgi:hypothetical protein